MQVTRHIFIAYCVLSKEMEIGGNGMGMLDSRFFGMIFGVVFVTAVLTQTVALEQGKVIKKVPTTHKVVSL